MSDLFGAQAAAGALRTHTARKEGRTVAIIALGADGTSVEAQVFPIGQADALFPGPYRFAAPGEAAAFLDETVEALTYLGCEIN